MALPSYYTTALQGAQQYVNANNPGDAELAGAYEAWKASPEGQDAIKYHTGRVQALPGYDPNTSAQVVDQALREEFMKRQGNDIRANAVAKSKDPAVVKAAQDAADREKLSGEIRGLAQQYSNGAPASEQQTVGNMAAEQARRMAASRGFGQSGLGLANTEQYTAGALANLNQQYRQLGLQAYGLANNRDISTVNQAQDQMRYMQDQAYQSAMQKYQNQAGLYSGIGAIGGGIVGGIAGSFAGGVGAGPGAAAGSAGGAALGGLAAGPAPTRNSYAVQSAARYGRGGGLTSGGD